MELTISNDGYYFTHGHNEWTVRKVISENPFLKAGRDSLIQYLDTATDGRLTKLEQAWFLSQQTKIAESFFILEGKDY